MKRKYKPSKRKKNFRQPVRNLIIICEGTTETIYFDNFKDRDSGLIITTKSDDSTNPEGIVKDAIRYCKENPVSIKTGDIVWCVFDVDSSDNAELAKAKKLADKKGYRIALSNPAIELFLTSGIGRIR